MSVSRLTRNSPLSSWHRSASRLINVFYGFTPNASYVPRPCDDVWDVVGRGYICGYCEVGVHGSLEFENFGRDARVVEVV
jgi:hypothetical protein